MNLPCFVISRPDSTGSTELKTTVSSRFRILILSGILIIAALQAGCGLRRPVDGSGYLEILHAGVRLGRENWYPRFTLNCGRGGIAEGGTVRLQLPSELVDTSKLANAVDNGFLTVATDRPDAVLSVSDCLIGDLWQVDVTVKEGSLKTGSELLINFDRRIPPVNSGRFYVGFFVDADGDGEFQPIGKVPPILVTPNMIIKCPRLLHIGKPFDVKVRVQTGPLRDAYEGNLLFTCTDNSAYLPSPYRFEQGENGVHRFEESLILFTPGYHVLTVFDIENPALQGEVVVACREKEMGYNLYFGETHDHTSFTDGRGLPVDYFLNARDQKHLDFVMLSDHDYLLDDDEWEYLTGLVDEMYEPGDFVTLHAYEWSSKFGDKNIYFRGGDPVLLRRNEPGSDHPLDLYDSFRGEQVLMIPHHPASAFRPTDWRFHDPSLVRVVEVYSLHGRSESYACKNPITPNTPPNQKYTTEESVINVRERSLQDALARGLRVGIIGGGDSHSGLPATLGIAAVYAEAQTREAIFDALYARRCYGTTHARLVLDFRVDGHIMGEEYVSPEDPFIEVTVIGTGPIALIEIIRNNEVLLSRECSEAQASVTFRDVKPRGGSTFYYARITQQDGEMAWSSPVWVDHPLPDLELVEKSVRIHQLSTSVVKCSGSLFNDGAGRAGASEATLYDSFEGGPERAVSTVLTSPAAGGDSTSFELKWNTFGEQGRHRIRVVADSGNQVEEADEHNNACVVDYVITSRTIMDETVEERGEGGTWYDWKKFDFVSEDEWVRIDIDASADFSGVRGKSPAILDDDLAFALDGVDYRFSDEYSWDGGFLRGRSMRVSVSKLLERGSHVLSFVADRKPFLERVRITGAGRSAARAAAESDGIFQGFKGDEFRWLDFTIEDGVSLWRQPVDDRRIVLNIIWSKDYGSTSNFTESYRWYRGELRFENCTYNVIPWRFREASDHFVDDGAGSVSWVFRAKKPGGIVCIIEALPGESPSVLFDILNGGRRFPSNVYLSDETLQSLPVRLELDGDRLASSDPELESISTLKGEGACNMALHMSASAPGFDETLDLLYSGLSNPETRIENLLLATRRNPRSAQIRFSLGKLYKQLKKFDKAVESFESARDLGKEDAYLFLNLGVCYRKLGRGSEAEWCLLTTLEKDHLLVRGYLELGKLYHDSGKDEEALKCFENATAIQSFNAEGQYYVGELSLRAGLTEKAETAWRECVRLDPSGRLGRMAREGLERLHSRGALETGGTTGAGAGAREQGS